MGTHVESISTEWKAVYKRGRSHVGKTAWQSEDVMWTELSVGKYVSHVPGKAAIVHTAPLLPKLRGYFAEFLNNASSVGLRILSSSTCVGLRYGHI